MIIDEIHKKIKKVSLQFLVVLVLFIHIINWSHKEFTQFHNIPYKIEASVTKLKMSLKCYFKWLQLLFYKVYALVLNLLSLIDQNLDKIVEFHQPKMYTSTNLHKKMKTSSKE